MHAMKPNASAVVSVLGAALSNGCSYHWECDEDQVALLQSCDHYVVLEPQIQEAFADPNPVAYSTDVTLYAVVEAYKDVFPVKEVVVDFPASDLETRALEYLGNNQYATSVDTSLFTSEEVAFTIDAINVQDIPALFPVTSYFTITERED